jgi:uncharacterized protein YecT (DUF1311 family)
MQRYQSGTVMQLEKISLIALPILLAACSASTTGKAASIESEPQGVPKAATVVASEQESNSASGSALRASYQDCVSANNGSTWDMQDCIEAEFVYQDARLNSAYKALMSGLPNEGREKLKAEERAWISDKETTCKWNAETEGQAQRIEANLCSLEQTAARAEYLEVLIQKSINK